jgi:hypothetical protein
MFSLSRMICFVHPDLDVLSIWIDMFCLSGMICFFLSKHINPDRQNILIRMNWTYNSRQTKHINPDRQNILIRMNWTYHYVLSNLDWYVLSVWIDMFCLSGLICFVCLEWYVLSVWIDMFCLSGMICSVSGMICFVYLDWYVLINPDRQNISFQIDKRYHSRKTKHIIPDRQNISIQKDKTS